MYFAVFMSPVAILDLPCPFSVQHSLQYTGMSTSKVLYIRGLVCLLILHGSRTWLMILLLLVSNSSVNSFVRSFSLSYDILTHQ